MRVGHHALLAAALWINLATWIGAPVSTTHSVVGGVMGAGIAAAALLVGAGGGYAIGAGGDGGDSSAGLVSADGGGAEPAMSLQGGEGAEEAAGGELAMAAPSDARDMMWWGGGRTVFTASGLSGEATVAHAWGFDSDGAFTKEAAAAAAAALGVEGTPELRDGAWNVGPSDGTGAGLQLYADGTVSLSYWDPAKDPWACAPVPAEGIADDGGADTSSSAQGDTLALPEVDPCQPRDVGPAPDGDAAAGALSDLLVALGLDPTSFEWQVEHTADSPEWTFVTAWQVLDGRRTGVSWNATLTGAGVQSVYGSTATLVDLGEYPVISPADAVERLMDPRFGAGFGGPMFYETGEDGLLADEPVISPPAMVVPPTLGAGATVQWPVETATIVEARLGLALHTQPNGGAMLVPTYELVSDAGAVWSVIAVADELLDFSPVGLG